MWNKVMKQVNKELPPFNRYLLEDYKTEQIDKAMDYTIHCFEEAIKLFGDDVSIEEVRVITPAEKLSNTYIKSRFANTATVDITLTELKTIEFTFRVFNELSTVEVLLPYLSDGGIWINGTKYYLIFPLTDSVFYHISRENGLGIKVLTSHLRFYKNRKGMHSCKALSGNVYHDIIIVSELHRRETAYTIDDIKPTIFIYFLCHYGFEKTLEIFGLNKDVIDIVSISQDEALTQSEMGEFEYFPIREAVIKDEPSLYLKVSNSIISTNPGLEIFKEMRVVTHLHYCLQYFTRTAKTVYTDNDQLACELKNSVVPWQIILGKMTYGMAHPQEYQVLDHAKVHLESLTRTLDIKTKMKLQEIDIHCEDVYELLEYIFLNIDKYLIGYIPSNLYNKRINILDLLLGNMVQGVFSKIYRKTNNKKFTYNKASDISNLFRSASRAINKIHKCSQVVTGNPAIYNDNKLLTIGARKVRATHSPNSGGVRMANSTAKVAANSKQSGNNLFSPQHRMHSSWIAIESVSDISGQNPGIAGSINCFVSIDHTGKFLQSEYFEELKELDKVLLTM